MHPETGEHIIFAERKPIDFAQVDQFVSAFNGVSAPVDRGNDVVVAAGDRLKLTGIASDADDEAYYASIIAKLQERDRQRSSELARRNNWIANENAIGADVQFKLGTAPIRETVVPAPISVETPTVADQSDERWVPNPDGIGGSVVAQPMTPSETDAIDAQIRQGTNDAMVIGGVSRRDGSDWVNPYDATDGWDFRWNPGGQTTVRITLDLVGCGLQKAGAGGTGQGETLIEVPAQRKR